MRTTVTIDDGLLELAKRRARTRKQTLGDLVEESLRLYLAHLDRPTRSGPPLPVFTGGALRPGIDPASNASLFDAAADKAADFAAQGRPGSA